MKSPDLGKEEKNGQSNSRQGHCKLLHLRQDYLTPVTARVANLTLHMMSVNSGVSPLWHMH